MGKISHFSLVNLANIQVRLVEALLAKDKPKALRYFVSPTLIADTPAAQRVGREGLEMSKQLEHTQIFIH